MRTHLKIGSRESALAVRQAEIVKEALEKASPGLTIEIVTMKTTGDKILHKSLEKIGGKGLFVKELDRALLNGDIDLSVHSLKDMPMEIPKRASGHCVYKQGGPERCPDFKAGNSGPEGRRNHRLFQQKTVSAGRKAVSKVQF